MISLREVDVKVCLSELKHFKIISWYCDEPIDNTFTN